MLVVAASRVGNQTTTIMKRRRRQARRNAAAAAAAAARAELAELTSQDFNAVGFEIRLRHRRRRFLFAHKSNVVVSSKKSHRYDCYLLLVIESACLVKLPVENNERKSCPTADSRQHSDVGVA